MRDEITTAGVLEANGFGTDEIDALIASGAVLETLTIA